MRVMCKIHGKSANPSALCVKGRALGASENKPRLINALCCRHLVAVYRPCFSRHEREIGRLHGQVEEEEKEESFQFSLCTVFECMGDCLGFKIHVQWPTPITSTVIAFHGYNVPILVPRQNSFFISVKCPRL